MTKNNEEKMIETINQIKLAGMFNIFKYAMEEIVDETNKPQDEWNEDVLNKFGLKYDKSEYIAVERKKRWGLYDYHEDYLHDLKKAGYLPASESSKYCGIGKYNEYNIKGLEFGSIKWNPYVYNYLTHEEIEPITQISYEVFYGMTALQVLQVLFLAEHIKIYKNIEELRPI